MDPARDGVAGRLVYTALDVCGTEAFHGSPPVRPSARAGDRPRLRIPLQPVDTLTVTTVVDNVYDVFMPDQGPARRSGPGSTGGRLPLAGYEPGFPLQEAWHGDRWEPDPLVLDDQAVIVNVRDRGLVGHHPVMPVWSTPPAARRP